MRRILVSSCNRSFDAENRFVYTSCLFQGQFFSCSRINEYIDKPFDDRWCTLWHSKKNGTRIFGLSGGILVLWKHQRRIAKERIGLFTNPVRGVSMVAPSLDGKLNHWPKQSSASQLPGQQRRCCPPFCFKAYFSSRGKSMQCVCWWYHNVHVVADHPTSDVCTNDKSSSRCHLSRTHLFFVFVFVQFLEKKVEHLKTRRGLRTLEARRGWCCHGLLFQIVWRLLAVGS